jgi:hypothetical protein
MQDVFGYQEMFQVQASACPPALQVRCLLQTVIVVINMLRVWHPLCCLNRPQHACRNSNCVACWASGDSSMFMYHQHCRCLNYLAVPLCIPACYAVGEFKLLSITTADAAAGRAMMCWPRPRQAQARHWPSSFPLQSTWQQGHQWWVASYTCGHARLGSGALCLG